MGMERISAALRSFWVVVMLLSSALINCRGGLELHFLVLPDCRPKFLLDVADTI